MKSEKYEQGRIQGGRGLRGPGPPNQNIVLGFWAKF